MPSPLVRLADIAAKAGVTKATVSMALRNHLRISEKQRVRIQLIATEMGWRNNALLGQLMHELRRSRTRPYVAPLALINVSRDANIRRNISIVMDRYNGVEQRAEQLGYSIDHFWLYEAGMTPDRLARIFRSRGIQGVIIHGHEQEESMEALAPVWEQFSCVTVGSRIVHPALNFVSNDQYSTALRACERLRALGYARIGLVMDRWLDNKLEHRFVGGLRSRPEIGASIPVLYLENTYLKRNIAAEKRAFLRWRGEHQPDACISISAHLVEWLRNAGLRVPEDIGFAILDLPKELKGKIAGMDQQHTCMGMSAVDVLIGQLLRRETGVPPIQQGTLIESSWTSGPTIQDRKKSSKTAP